MTYPKIKECPTCEEPGDNLSVYTYDSGGRHVECNKCHYLGPCGGSILSAIRLHNQRVEAVRPEPAREMNYQALVNGDSIEKGDEYLDDDDVTWSAVTWLWYTCVYDSDFFRPMRRLV